MRPGESEGSEEELRLSVALLPLRLRIDQAVVDFCQVSLSAQTCCWCTRPTSPAHGISKLSEGVWKARQVPQIAVFRTP